MTFFSDAAQFLPALLGGLRVSLALTGLSLLFGLPLATLLSFGSRSVNKAMRWLSIAFVEVGRGAGPSSCCSSCTSDCRRQA